MKNHQDNSNCISSLQEFENQFGKSRFTVDDLQEIICEYRAFIEDYLFSLPSPHWDKPKNWSKDEKDNLNNLKRKIKESLIKLQSNSIGSVVCAYCRYPISDFGEHGDIEHFLLKSKYFHLTFAPWNLVLSCKECNRDRKRLDDLAENLKSHKLLKRILFSGTTNDEKVLQNFRQYFSCNTKKEMLFSRVILNKNTLEKEKSNEYFSWIHPYYDSYFEYIKIKRTDKGQYIYNIKEDINKYQQDKALRTLKSFRIGFYDSKQKYYDFSCRDKIPRNISELNHKDKQTILKSPLAIR